MTVPAVSRAMMTNTSTSGSNSTAAEAVNESGMKCSFSGESLSLHTVLPNSRDPFPEALPASRKDAQAIEFSFTQPPRGSLTRSSSPFDINQLNSTAGRSSYGIEGYSPRGGICSSCLPPFDGDGPTLSAFSPVVMNGDHSMVDNESPLEVITSPGGMADSSLRENWEFSSSILDLETFPVYPGTWTSCY